MDLKNEFVTSVKKENNLGYYRIHTIWKDESFRINIASKDASWSGEMTPENIKELSNHLQLDKQTYIQNCKEALTIIDEKPDMKYSIENGSFVWKKLVDEDSGISVKLGSVRVEPTNFVETIQNMVDVTLKTIKNERVQNSNFNEEKEKLVSKNNELFSALESARASKEKLETDLYTKFIEVLNSKKKIILSLQNQLENKNSTKDDNEIKETKVLKTTRQTKSRKPTKAPPKATTRRTRSSQKALDNEAYEMDTDNDSDGETAEKKQRRSTRLNEQKSINVSDGAASSSQSLIPESYSVANDCLVEDKAKNDGNDSDSTISDESLANYAKGITFEKNEVDGKLEDDHPSPKKSKNDEKINENQVSPQKSKNDEKIGNNKISPQKPKSTDLSQLDKDGLLEFLYG